MALIDRIMRFVRGPQVQKARVKAEQAARSPQAQRARARAESFVNDPRNREKARRLMSRLRGARPR